MSGSKELNEAAIAERDRIIEQLEAADPGVRIGGSGCDLVTLDADVSYTRDGENHRFTYWVTVSAIDTESDEQA